MAAMVVAASDAAATIGEGAAIRWAAGRHGRVRGDLARNSRVDGRDMTPPLGRLWVRCLLRKSSTTAVSPLFRCNVQETTVSLGTCRQLVKGIVCLLSIGSASHILR